MGVWILFQNQANNERIGATLFTTGRYIEMVIAARTSMTPSVEEGVIKWRIPLGEGAAVHVALEDCGHYVRWLFDYPERVNGLDLEVILALVPYKSLAATFQKVTGRPAQYISTLRSKRYKVIV